MSSSNGGVDVKPTRWIYLSPHLDDAILSCGALIWEQARLGIPIEIWTVFAGIPLHAPISDFARLIHAMWGTGSARQTVIQRRKEDRQAAALLGVKAVHLPFIDCIYRQSPSGDFLYTESVTTAIQTDDLNLVEMIAARLSPRLRKEDVLVCPLALGGHVDHMLVRRAAEFLYQSLLYYTDIPYVLNTPQAFEPAIAALKGQVYPLSAEAVNAWLQAVGEYKSQLSSLYIGEGTLQDAMRAWVKERGGQPLWKVA